MRILPVLLSLAGLSACIPPGQDYSWPQNEAAPERAPMLETDQAVFRSTQVESQPAPWQTRGVVPVAAIVEDMTYVVKPGDTLRGIANKTGAGSQIIARVNGLVAPYIINPGQRLAIPGGRYHRISSGETGIAIARAYGVPWGDIVDLNDLDEPYILRVGQKLLLPASAPADPVNMSLEQRAAAFQLDIDDIVTGGQPALNDPASQVTSPAPSEWRKAIMPEKRVAPPSGFVGRFNWPVEGKLLSGFGSKGGGVVNDGLNIAVSEGTPILAAADGVVAYSGDEIDVFGGLILINHGSGWVTAYGHAARLHVERGQKVRAGEVIGLAGQSGYVKEPQLHFEIRKNRKPVDPALHLPERT